jgi:hypothetical protein
VIGTKQLIQSAQQLGVSETQTTPLHPEIVPNHILVTGLPPLSIRCRRKWLATITTRGKFTIATSGTRLAGRLLI